MELGSRECPVVRQNGRMAHVAGSNSSLVLKVTPEGITEGKRLSHKWVVPPCSSPGRRGPKEKSCCQPASSQAGECVYLITLLPSFTDVRAQLLQPSVWTKDRLRSKKIFQAFGIRWGLLKALWSEQIPGHADTTGLPSPCYGC